AAASRGFPPAGSGLTPEGWSRHAAYMNSLLVRSREQAAIMRAPRLLTGTDLMEHLGIREGPLVGRLLEAVREAQAVGEVVDTEGALALARRIARRESPEKQADGVERS
ncbi:MAG TPA: hypothetical protein VNM91_12275, partial [Dehalococcoidia bacterium]|nr:hypothetical protein [Dehalococcoidia bacterium]